MYGCPLYIHNAKKACFVRLSRCPYAPIHLDAPISLDTPVCLDGPLYIWMSPYVWMMFGCPLYKQHEESMLCQTKGCPYVPIRVDAPCTSKTERKHALSG